MIGSVLVSLQFLCLAVLAWRAVDGWRAGAPADPFMAGLIATLAIGGGALGLWSVLANRPGNFNIRPVPRAGGRLVEHGPYRWIRHPMYSALALAGAAAVLMAGGAPSSIGTANPVDPWFMRPGWQAALAWAVLVAVLAAKAEIEERGMLRAYPAYADYRRRTRRFVPGIY